MGKICVFRLRIPYLKPFNIPPGILKELRIVAMNLPNDLLTDDDLPNSDFASWEDGFCLWFSRPWLDELIVLVDHLQDQIFGRRITWKEWDT